MLIGQTISHYKITSKLGEGGMGEVYLAEDTRLGREVALKILPQKFVQDRQRMARFQREAEVLASLNHPNISIIHGLEESGEVLALVLELVEGDTLADRITQGAIPVDESLRLALQIAEALEAAHEKGIIHRDLKPANVKVTPDGKVKVLDFGLAKALELPTSEPELSESPTRSLDAAATQMGMVMGTAAYMSPEQARGKPVDKRADIWSLGCVLYEMLSGRRPFDGEDISKTLARVIEREPDWEALPASTPPGLVRLIRRCLRKDPKHRLHDIADARLDLEEAMEPPSWETTAKDSERPAMLRSALPWAIVMLMTLVATILVYRADWNGQEQGVTPAHLQIVLPEGLRLAVDTAHPTLALSPDGSRLVFVADDGVTRRLYLRHLAGSESREIAGTEGAASPFFSLDGEWIGFFAGTKLMKVSSSSGAPLAVHTIVPISVHRGAAWAADEAVVLAGSPNSGLRHGSVAGEGQRTFDGWTYVTDSTAAFSWPDVLPGGQSVLFTDNTAQSLDAARVKLLSLKTREIVPLGIGGTHPRYSATGHVVYGRDGSLYAVPFDVKRNSATDPEFRLLDGVLSDGNGSVQYTVGGNGTLAYVSGPPAARDYELVWIDREGHTETLTERNRRLWLPRVSPDGLQLAVTEVGGSNMDVWLFDLNRCTFERRLTTDPGEDFGPVWHPDGRQLALASEIDEDRENQGPGMAWIRDLGTLPEPLTRSPGEGNWEFPSSWSADGKWLAFVSTRNGPIGDISLFSPSDPGDLTSFLATPADEASPMFSPDGRWLAYVSDDTGQYEVWVEPFPGPGPRTRISYRGGVEPLWSRDGQELFYRQGDRLMRVGVDGSGERFVPKEPEILLELRLDHWSGFGAQTANYDISPDGSRFIMAIRKNPVTATVINIVLDWPQVLLAPSETSR